MININKLFPRLSIRVKLIIAFALVALGPLVVVSYLGARETVFQVKARAYGALEHDLEMAEARTTQPRRSPSIGALPQKCLGTPHHGLARIWWRARSTILCWPIARCEWCARVRRECRSTRPARPHL